MALEIILPGTIPTLDEFKKSYPVGVSPLNTPIFDDITFPSGSYINNNGDEVFYAGLKLISVKILINQKKNIIKTNIAGRDGTFKEYSSLGDYMISINSKINELFNIFPASEVEAWAGLQAVPENIKILSKLANDYFGITDVVLENFEISPRVGFLNEVNLNMVLSSDKNINFTNYVI